jgi:hypothetical protein
MSSDLVLTDKVQLYGRREMQHHACGRLEGGGCRIPHAGKISITIVVGNPTGFDNVDTHAQQHDNVS